MCCDLPCATSSFPGVLSTLLPVSLPLAWDLKNAVLASCSWNQNANKTMSWKAIQMRLTPAPSITNPTHPPPPTHIWFATRETTMWARDNWMEPLPIILLSSTSLWNHVSKIMVFLVLRCSIHLQPRQPCELSFLLLVVHSLHPDELVRRYLYSARASCESVTQMNDDVLSKTLMLNM